MKEKLIKRIKFLAFHRASSQMEELFQRAIRRLDFENLSEDDLKAIRKVMEEHDRTLELYILKGENIPDYLKRGLKLLNLLPKT
ncbi:MAG: hypothetical protein GXO39_09570 [Thermotogae bacterium]|nr:hypothetical protein [Thermotogota bacterium]